ncbi:putative 2OG-Fe(II) oxygenase [Novosphingobium sp.]|uniref:putative 2OG-Fe(II) oxygenase n=1 Tax=Novosphingobium sp. TaxID=1874826 RepID=UPI00286E6628|nr:putative 2OG-Fe(II) oxygenase [Novosphingobium sp.]
MPDEVRGLLMQVQALRQAQRLADADALLGQGRMRFPADPVLAFLHAQTRYELGHPAAALFGEAARLDPANLEAMRNRALALISEGAAVQAREVLEAELAARPDWLDGHKVLATLKWTHGEGSHFADHYAPACRALPERLELWLAWFRMAAQARDWQVAAAVLGEAERHHAGSPALLACRLFVAVESHDDAAVPALLAATAHLRGDVTSLCRIRHALRRGEPRAAEAEALALVGGPSAPLYWPYLSLAWRLLGDERWLWLDRPDDLIAELDSGIAAGEREELAALLRTLHTTRAPYIEQSVRGGTQTDRSVLLRHEVPLQRLKARMLELVSTYVAALPPMDAAHPLLCAPRGGPYLIEGSWSVRLERQGYNVPHSHAMGWLSTAFYVSLPEQMGAEPAGHIAFGAPPPELGLPLSAYRTIRPEPGRLAVFPSTTWHGTVPFDDGERLVVAFDIRRPQA